MTKTITQKIIFKNTKPKELYDLYMDAKKHSMITGSPANIKHIAGSRFTAFGGYAWGKNLHLVKNKQIVQTWKAEDWDKSVTDSTFILNLEQRGKDTIVHMTHANVPEKNAKDIEGGWHEFYWEPWKKHLEEKSKK